MKLSFHAGKDTIYVRPLPSIEPFAFNQKVAGVFDDMVLRSIPFYETVQALSADLVSQLYTYRGPIFDLGCSTGASMLHIAQRLDDSRLRLVGFDRSEPMARRCRAKLAGYKVRGNLHVAVCDILEAEFKDAEIILLHYVLQFLPVDQKAAFIKKLWNALEPGGALILSEKLRRNESAMQDIFTRNHHNFKASRGYSDLEIAQKREALESVLIPLSGNKLEALLRNAGFSHVEIFFQWFNFASFLAIK